MNSKGGRLLFFPKVNEAKLKEQKAIKASKLKIEIEHDMRRNKTTSLYNLYQKSPSEPSFEPKMKHPQAIFKNKKQRRLFNQYQIQSLGHQKIWNLINRNLFLRDSRQYKKTPYQANRKESIDDYEYINESNLLHRQSIQIVKDQYQIKRFMTQQKPQSNFNSQPLTQKLKQSFKVKAISMQQNITLSPRLQNMKSLRKNLKRKARIKIQLNEESTIRKVETKLMSLNGWKTQEDELQLNE